MNTLEFIKECQEKVFSGNHISSEDAKKLLDIPEENLKDLAKCANEITRDFNGDKVDVEQLNNIKKNACSEDCTFCGQSAFFDTGIESYQLPTPEEVVIKAQKAKDEGAESYCLVAAWREPSPTNFQKVCKIITEINNKVGISVECSLGFLTLEQAKKLKELRVKRYNHNLETAKSKFSEICTTHTYEDRLKTIRIAREAGLELCTGGIIGLGETREQRLELALELARLYPEEVTINILVPVPGTPLELQVDLPNSEIVRMFSVIRFLLPESVIKISGGRETNLDDSGEELLQSGANGIITAGYLTMNGNEAEKDLKMIERIGLKA
ncbi:MAG: biotin synthase BioB [Nitrosopumilus sp.]|uniref:biotin synthase BioB n=1 Tax=Nitrosopumilus sp. TaxID=2024843 RepID=UPI002472771A|nr:biotin synthase BioB [Nitrosopumilus sp.]MDH5430409.1 biotin synthase BioB [Nitrosopumilus sp.]MDH5665734.1 biotin synthase BioB [Nitrosopumilus sp.]MDH5697843.1 biotin synthase BioB [Nitrosopumilus sp.]